MKNLWGPRITFSERIEAAMARYHNRVIDALQVIEELIQIGRDLRMFPFPQSWAPSYFNIPMAV